MSIHLFFSYLAGIEHHMRSKLLIIENYSNSFRFVNEQFPYRIQ